MIALSVHVHETPSREVHIKINLESSNKRLIIITTSHRYQSTQTPHKRHRATLPSFMMMGSTRTPLGGKRPSAQQAREELINSRYNLTEPAGVYPLDGSTSHQGRTRYPDFMAWKHTADEDLIAESHLQKGYFEVPHVGNELLSARNIMHQLLRSKNSLDQLSSNLLKAVDAHSTNSKVGQGSYKPPPRVTLTDQKREAWLRDLAQTDVPLRKLARTIPHGVRNKQLLDQCLSKNIPINRAIWLVRCVSTNELRQLKRKGGANIEFQWVQEWTTQVLEFIEKLSHDYLNFETFHRATESWKFNVSYMLRFVSNLFIESLIDREIFKGWIIRFFRNCKTFELPLSLQFVKMFWKEICKTDYLIKELTESLILRYEKVNSVKSLLESRDTTVTDTQLNDEIKKKLLSEFTEMILESFSQSVDNFIIPASWVQLESTLKGVLNLTDAFVLKRFELISYRNESLMINYALDCKVSHKSIVSIYDEMSESPDFTAVINAMMKTHLRLNTQMLFRWALTKYRSGVERVYLASEVLKRLKSLPAVSLKDIEQEVLTFVFEIPVLQSQIVLNNLFLFLNELTRLKLFRVSTYMRRLISSGLLYQSNNDDEKHVHSQILKNLRPQKSSQASMILKNLDGSNELVRADREVKIRISLEIVNGPVNFFLDHQKVSYLECLEVGIKLELADVYLTGILARENLFPLLTYGEFQRIVKTVLLLEDYRGLSSLLVKALQSNSLEEKEIELICDILSTYRSFTATLTDSDTVFQLQLENSKRLNSVYCLRKFQSLVSSYPSADSLRREADLLLNAKSLRVDSERISGCLAESGLSLKVDQMLQESNVHNCFQTLIRSLFNNNTDGRTKNCVIILLDELKTLHTSEFNRGLFVHIKKTYSDISELFKYEPLLDLLIFDLVSMKSIVDMFLSFKSSAHRSVILELLFKDLSRSSSNDHFKLGLLRERFKRQHPESMMTLLKESLAESEAKPDTIQSESTEIINSLLPESSVNNYQSELFLSLLDVLTRDLPLAIDTVESLDATIRCAVVHWLHDTICSDEPKILTFGKDPQDQLVEYICRLDRFNLPIIQLLLKLTLRDDVTEDLLTSFLESAIIKSRDSQGTFDAVFDLLGPSLRRRILHYFESLFLNSPLFPAISIKGYDVNLDMISDTLISLSRGSQTPSLPDELLFSLDVSLESLIRAVSQPDKPLDGINTAISLFLKILIIHKQFLINIVIERNTIKETFLNNLVTLLTTNLVSQNLQLKNLLYDLILSFKSSVNELNSSQNGVVKLALSMMSLPAISPAVEQTAKAPLNGRNLHNFSISSNLFLQNRTQGSFHELNLKPFDMVEDSNALEAINDTAVSLQLFEGSIERKNPT